MGQGIVQSPKSGRAHWPSYYYGRGAFEHLPAGLKPVVSRPVVGAKRIDSPALADRLIGEGSTDIVDLARTLIADPYFPNKGIEGWLEDIRPCIACAQSCVGHIPYGLPVGCIYNPVTGREDEWAEVAPSPMTKKVIVVGDGPAGMEAARVWAEGLTTADCLADQGSQVELVTGLAHVGPDLPSPSWHNLLEQLMLKRVGLTPFTGVWEVLADSVDVYNVVTWEPRTIEDVDTVMFASGGFANDTLYHELVRHRDNVHVIGDAFQPRDIEIAVVDGHRIARKI